MDDYYLEDWQKDLVREGKYEPWNFEEDNLEEEDYYYDDSKQEFIIFNMINKHK